MCGIAGIISKTPRNGLAELATGLQEALRHRGPDDEGAYISPSERALLVHTRLAILDLSPAGHQPMVRSGLQIVFNGEIFNFRELRAELEAAGEVFTTRSDTEVILALYHKEGQKCVSRLRGMFAFAIWDEAKQTAFLARDSFGIKPLYLCETESGFSFASELRALAKTGLCGKELNPEAVVSFLRFGTVAEPLTMLQGVTMLPAGHAMEWQDGALRKWEFWQPAFSKNAPENAVKTAREALLNSIQAHLVSDAPVGVFLSGGMDSTTVAAFAKKCGIGDLRTFSIGFAEAEFDESSVARATAEAFGAKHQEWIISAAEGRSLLGGFLKALDQPTIDGLNTYCVSKFARDGGCKVVLSGLGGDEVFGGYPTFQRLPQLMTLHKLLGWIPGLRWLGAKICGSSSSPLRKRLGEFLQSNGSASAAYDACRSLFTEVEARKLAEYLLGKPLPTHTASTEPTLPTMAPQDAASVLELSRYMRNQLLRDSDVMSMRWGLELRVPMVDQVLFESLSSIPHAVRLAVGKRLLADAVPEIPAMIYERPKRGFMFPFARWMEGDWQEMMTAAGKEAPVPLANWYQRWALFIFRQWHTDLVK